MTEPKLISSPNTRAKVASVGEVLPLNQGPSHQQRQQNSDGLGFRTLFSRLATSPESVSETQSGEPSLSADHHSLVGKALPATGKTRPVFQGSIPSEPGGVDKLLSNLEAELPQSVPELPSEQRAHIKTAYPPIARDLAVVPEGVAVEDPEPIDLKAGSQTNSQSAVPTSSLLDDNRVESRLLVDLPAALSPEINAALAPDLEAGAPRLDEQLTKVDTTSNQSIEEIEYKPTVINQSTVAETLALDPDKLPDQLPGNLVAPLSLKPQTGGVGEPLAENSRTAGSVSPSPTLLTRLMSGSSPKDGIDNLRFSSGASGGLPVSPVETGMPVLNSNSQTGRLDIKPDSGQQKNPSQFSLDHQPALALNSEGLATTKALSELTKLPTRDLSSSVNAVELAAGEPSTTVNATATGAAVTRTIPGTNVGANPVLQFGDIQQFSEGLAEQVTVMTRNGVNTAQISLNPEELGRLEIRLSLKHDEANVQLMSHNALVRDAIDEAMPRLRELLDQVGVRLASYSVGSEFNDRNAQRGDHRDAYQGEGVDIVTESAEGNENSKKLTLSTGLIDTYI